MKKKKKRRRNRRKRGKIAKNKIIDKHEYFSNDNRIKIFQVMTSMRYFNRAFK